jgi:N utilization substance protein B
MLERCIMRVALVEMLYPDAVPSDSPIPPAGAIDAAVEVSKEYCGAQSPAFINGILNAAMVEIEESEPADE